MGGAWGINRTMAQVHALLMTSDRPLTTDEVMADLKISRGNAHQNLRELIGWGLVRSVIRKGERKEFFEAEKDVWRMFCTVARERQRREIEPALRALHACEAQTRGLRGEKAAAFNRQIPRPLRIPRPSPWHHGTRLQVRAKHHHAPHAPPPRQGPSNNRHGKPANSAAAETPPPLIYAELSLFLENYRNHKRFVHPDLL